MAQSFAKAHMISRKISSRMSGSWRGSRMSIFLPCMYLGDYGSTNRGMVRLEKGGCAWTKVCVEPGELLCRDSRTLNYNLSSVTYRNRFCVYTCL